MHRIPTASYMLVVFMALAATLIVNYIMDANLYLTLTAFPSLLFSGLAGNAALIIYGITLSHDRAANIALSTCVGFVALAITVFLSLRIWHIIQEHS